MRPVVSIVGRPNVGKSTLFNRIVGQRRAIVHDSPGVTRDRIFALALLGEQEIWLVDTGGLEPGKEDKIATLVNEQVIKACEEAHLLLVVFDGRDGLTPEDQEVVSRLRRIGKPAIAVVNKIDPDSKKGSASEFYRVGFDELVEISAEHGSGIDDLRGLMQAKLEPLLNQEPPAEISDRTEIAFIGRPNVGKSSLINAILKEPRLAVSDIPGTTRDMTDTPVEQDGVNYLLLDTAGIRRRGKIIENVEHYSAVRALKAIDRARVVVLVVDATAGITTQDARIAAAAVEAGAGILMAVNKWDLKEDSDDARRKFRQEIYDNAPFLSFADVRFVSAKTGLRIDGLLPAAHRIFRSLNHKFTKAEMDEAYEEILAKNPPYGSKGFRLRMLGMTSAEARTPTFYIWCNDPRLVDASYQRFWKNALGEKLQLSGVPIRAVFRRKAPKTKKTK